MNKFKYYAINSFIVLLTCSFLISCSNNDLEEAKDSLEGNWKIERILTNIGTRTELGFSVDFTTDESGDLGYFNFDPSNVEYEISSSEWDEMGNSTWSLTKEKVNCGFTQCTEYTLQLESKTFDCNYGDQTSDAHVNATEVQLSYETTEIGPYKGHFLYLKKS